ncbi:unnamed protein product [Clonostachys rosea f. rosea IK726]|uniref:Uncharacterized protein n=2 Tax=Bionectria ochroleuca TaxID=29856 RepID=A0A0B7K766_BIOOC|nr:unnamed protein product [Clonostachys rosea f. rosea IK726]
MQSEAETPLLRRLNGRPQACDPCRLRKVACDHTQPMSQTQPSQCLRLHHRLHHGVGIGLDQGHLKPQGN